MNIYDCLNLLLQGATVFALLGTFWVYYQQLKTMQKQLIAGQDASYSENLLALIDYLQEEDIREARRILFEETKERTYPDEWDEVDRKIASKICANYSTAAVAMEKDPKLARPILEHWCYSIDESYRIIEPFLLDMQTKVGDNYWSMYKWLFSECQAFLESETRS